MLIIRMHTNRLSIIRMLTNAQPVILTRRLLY